MSQEKGSWLKKGVIEGTRLLGFQSKHWEARTLGIKMRDISCLNFLLSDPKIKKSCSTLEKMGILFLK